MAPCILWPIFGVRGFPGRELFSAFLVFVAGDKVFRPCNQLDPEVVFSNMILFSLVQRLSSNMKSIVLHYCLTGAVAT